MKLLIISHSAHLGGAERSLLTLIENLYQAMEIMVVLPETGELEEKLKNLGIEICITNYSWWTIKRSHKPKKDFKNFDKYYSQAKKLLVLLSDWKPNIIYTNTSVVCIGGLLARIMKIPHVWHIREFGEKDHGFIFEYGIKNTSEMIDALSTSVIFNSKATRREFTGIIRKTNIIYNAVDIPVIKNDRNTRYFKYKESIKILIAGTISERKGQYDGVRAVAKLIEKGVNVELVLLGHCNYKELTKKIEKIKHSCIGPSRIQLLEYTNNPYPAFKEADIILVTSKNEAFGRTILEGWLFNKPIIATNSGGIPEIIDDNVTGLLYDAGNIGELTNKIELLAGNKHLREDIGKHGYDIVKTKFSVKNYVSRIEKVLRDACDIGFKEEGLQVDTILN